MSVGVVLAGCERRPTYSRATPDDVVKSAVAMVRDGRSGELGTLIAPDGPEMQVMLDRLGVLLGHMQTLSKAVRERWPAEFEKMRIEAGAAAAGKANPLVGALFSQRKPNGGGGGPSRTEIRDLINRLFADPYGWLEANASKLTTTQTTDDTAAVLFDGQPVIPVVGLPMRKIGEEWFVSLPTQLPPISGVWPRTKPEWSIIASLVLVIDRAVVELTGDVQAGKVATLGSLRDKAVDKLIFPAAIAFVAYGRELEVRRGIETRTREFEKHRRAWAQARSKEPHTPATGAISRELLDAIDEIARPKIEEWVRKRKGPKLDGMSGKDFEALIGGWMNESGLGVPLDGELEGPGIEATLAAWWKARAAAQKKP